MGAAGNADDVVGICAAVQRGGNAVNTQRVIHQGLGTAVVAVEVDRSDPVKLDSRIGEIDAIYARDDCATGRIRRVLSNLGGAAASGIWHDIMMPSISLGKAKMPGKWG